AIYRQLLDNLLGSGRHMVIRVGGSAMDKNKTAIDEQVRPLAELYKDLSQPEPRVSFILGVNLGANDIALASRQTDTWVKGMPLGSISAIEPGTQPNTYPALNYRPAGYSFTDYLTELQKFTQGIQTAVPVSPKFMGPSVAVSGTVSPSPRGFGTAANLQKLVQLPHLGIASQTASGGLGSGCGGTPQSGMLLQPAAIESPGQIAPLVRIAKAANKPFRIAELSTLSCSGEAGISNAFESALWVTDILFEYARAGVSGVHVHTNNWNATGWDMNAAFLFEVPEAQYQAANTVPPPAETSFSSEYRLKSVLPLYYGMLFFAEATNRASLIPAQLNTTANIKAWATIDQTSDELKIAVINKEQDLLGKIQLVVPGYRAGTVKRLMAPSIRSQNGITFGGLTFDGSTDGKPIGKEDLEEVNARGEQFEIALGPGSALLITFKK
ncbi:MAG TPA: glycosyl hydrolase family 79 C-terminal domain-containing protein, partial [Sphingobacteriaceae bacterium]